jgi:hypothetical protein
MFFIQGDVMCEFNYYKFQILYFPAFVDGAREVFCTLTTDKSKRCIFKLLKL